MKKTSTLDFGFYLQPVDKALQLVKEILALGKTMSLGVDGDDLNKSVEEHSAELRTDELENFTNSIGKSLKKRFHLG